MYRHRNIDRDKITNKDNESFLLLYDSFICDENPPIIGKLNNVNPEASLKANKDMFEKDIIIKGYIKIIKTGTNMFKRSTIIFFSKP